MFLVAGLAGGCWSELEAEGDYDPPRVIEILPASPVLAIDGENDIVLLESGSSCHTLGIETLH